MRDQEATDLAFVRWLREAGVADLDIFELPVGHSNAVRIEELIFRLLYGVDSSPYRDGGSTSRHSVSWDTPLDKDNFTSWTLARLRQNRILTFGVLQMFTTIELDEHCGIRAFACKRLVESLDEKGLRLRDEDESLKTRAENVFKKPWRIPVSYLEARGAIQSSHALTDRGVYKLWGLTRVPKWRLATVKNKWVSRPEFDVNRIEAELQALGLDFAK